MKKREMQHLVLAQKALYCERKHRDEVEMKKQNSTNITNDDIETIIELSYTMAEDGMLYPNISFETENLAELGKYGLMAMDYLKDNYNERYRSLERTGRLVQVLKLVNEEAHQMVDRMMEKYLQTHMPSDPASTMEMWKIREQGLMQAEEIVVHEIVNIYH